MGIPRDPRLQVDAGAGGAVICALRKPPQNVNRITFVVRIDALIVLPHLMTGYATAALPQDAEGFAKPFTLDALMTHVRSVVSADATNSRLLGRLSGRP